MERLTKPWGEIVSFENCWRAWALFRRGKRHRPDVRVFERHLEQNLLEIRCALIDGSYHHGPYRAFVVYDPKRRVIHAPGIRDQLVHQMVWNVVFSFLDRRFSPAAMSCRPGHGTHAAVVRMQKVAKQLGKRERVYALHLDIVKFFDSVPHAFLRVQLRRWIACEPTLRLLHEIIWSYDSGFRLDGDPPDMRRGIPLGNLTSQLFANVVLMPIDRMVEAAGWGRAYIRYADDLFVVGVDAAALRAFGERCESALRDVGFACRRRVWRWHGFEALGVRLFSDGCTIRRSTRRQAIAALEQRARTYVSGERSVASFDATTSSLRGLAGGAGDVRWSRAITRTVLTYAS